LQNLKFRIYDKFNKNVCEVLEIDFKRQKVTALFRKSLPNIFDFDDVEFLQFVGLKDIYNKDIYEKDVLYNGTDRYEVIYDAQRACFLGKLENHVDSLNHLINNGYYIDKNNCRDKN
jgi:hypothetical protein